MTRHRALVSPAVGYLYVRLGMVGRRTAALVVTLTAASVLSGCDDGGPMVREVLVDFSHDEFPSSMVDFFPDVLTVHPGATVRFKQAWTGEPHSVTFGAAFNDELGDVRSQLAERRPHEPDEIVGLSIIDALPAMLGREGNEFVVNQNAAQPCYLDEGLPPADPDEPCPRRDQPLFTGEHSYYSSGFIPYEGESGNNFEITVADDIEPGTYNYYCNLHGVGQSGAIEVVAAGDEVPSRSRVAREAYQRVRTLYEEPLQAARAQSHRDALQIDDRRLPLPLAGVASDTTRPWAGLAHRRHFAHRHGSANEFVPSEFESRVGQKVTWTFVGRHTISFNVPAYLPVFEVGGDGSVSLDPNVYEAVGWTDLPPPRWAGDPAQPVHADAGAWDGTGFRSTGLDWATGDTFSLTFTQPGTYPYACLVHPAMVGSVKIRP